MRNDDWQCCPDMNPGNTYIVINPVGSFHYGKVLCLSCDHFIKWLANPKTTEITAGRCKKYTNY